jgi:hypothetical protein
VYLFLRRYCVVISTFALLGLSTLARGGNRSLPLIGLEWLGLAICLAWGWDAQLRGRLPNEWGLGPSRWALLALAALPFGGTFLTAFGGGSGGAAPLAGWTAALAAWPVAAMWLVALSANPAHVRSLARAWLWVALAQAVIGFMQLGGWEAWRFGLESGEKLIGTFASKNTYSNFMVMAIPLVVYSWLAPPDDSAAGHKPSNHNGRAWFWGAVLFVLLAAISLSNSRTGIVTGVLTALLSVALLKPPTSGGRCGGGQRRRWIWLGAAALLGAVALAGGLDWLARFEGERLAADSELRAMMREATWQGAMAQWPWGSGLGSYRWVFPAYQPAELGGWVIDLAHNDYLQFFMELGVVFVALAALVAALVARRVWLLIRAARGERSKGKTGERARGRRDGGGRKGWSEADRLAVACGLGALATALHALVDYPLHIPANAMMAAFLLGVFLREPEETGAPAVTGAHALEK